MLTVRWIKEAAFAPKPSLACRISLAGAVLIASIFGIPASASATLLGQAAGAVGSVVPPLTEAVVPPLPSAPAPQTLVPTAPGVSVETSSAPQAPPVKLPTAEGPGTTPNSSNLAVPSSSGSTKKVSSAGVDLPPAADITSGTKDPAGTATSTSTEVQKTHVSTGNGVGKGSVESTRAAPVRRSLAHVWPAIALGPAGKLLAILQARWTAATSLPAVAAGIARSLSDPKRVAGAGSAAGLSEHSAISRPSSAWIPDGTEISLLVLVISCAALMALLVFTVGRELGSFYRWPL